jgi:creatinine amidohydrolase
MTRLADLPFVEIEERLALGAVALWPIGSTEAHGPHLPLATDVIIAEESCRRAAPLILEALDLEALIMPPLAFTVTEYAAPFTGTISISKATATAYVKEVLVSAAAQGFKAVIMVNAHLEPAHRFALRDAVKAARAEAKVPVALADPCDRRWVSRLTAEFQTGNCHAGQYETSLVLAAPGAPTRPALTALLDPVGLDLVGGMQAGKKNFVEIGASRAYFGAPAAATVEEGNATYQTLAEIVLTTLQEALAPENQ